MCLIGSYLGVIGRQDPEIILRDLTGCPVSRHTFSKVDFKDELDRLDNLHLVDEFPIMFESKEVNGSSANQQTEFISSSGIVAPNSGYLLTGIVQGSSVNPTAISKGIRFYRLERVSPQLPNPQSASGSFPDNITLSEGMLTAYFAGFMVVHYREDFSTTVKHLVTSIDYPSSGGVDKLTANPIQSFQERGNLLSGEDSQGVEIRYIGEATLQLPAGTRGVCVGISYLGDRRRDPGSYLFGREEYQNTYLIIRRSAVAQDQSVANFESATVCSNSRETWLKLNPYENMLVEEVVHVMVEFLH